MSTILHRAIRDGIRDAHAYHERGILVSQLLEATVDLMADESLLYQSVYTIFRALPARLLAGSILLVSTEDVEGGVQLTWEGREPAEGTRAEGTDVRNLLRVGPHGDLMEIALVALERFCQARAGYVESTVERVPIASAFERPPHVIRRVVAFLPTRSGALSAGQSTPARAGGQSRAPWPSDPKRGRELGLREPRMLLTKIRHV